MLRRAITSFHQQLTGIEDAGCGIESPGPPPLPFGDGADSEIFHKEQIRAIGGSLFLEISPALPSK